MVVLVESAKVDFASWQDWYTVVYCAAHISAHLLSHAALKSTTTSRKEELKVVISATSATLSVAGPPPGAVYGRAGKQSVCR